MNASNAVRIFPARWPVPVAIAAALALGFLAGRFLAPHGSLRLLLSAPSAAASAPTTNPKSPAAKLFPNATTLAAILAEPDAFRRTSDLYAFAATLDIPALRALLGPASHLKLLPNFYDAQNALLQRLADLDPLAALNIPGVDKNGALTAALTALAVTDPAKALAVLRAQQGAGTSFLYTQLFSTWAQRDPAAAAAAALALPGGQLRANALKGVVSGWVVQDPAAALAWANALPSGSTRTGTVGAVLIALAAQDPAAAVSYLGSTTSPQQHDAFVQTIAESWARQDPAAAFAWIDQSFTGAQHDALAMTILKQAAAAGVADSAILAKIPTTPSFDQNVAELVTYWQIQDPQAALAWLQTLPAPTDADGIRARNSAYTTIVNQMCSSDPAGAAALLQSLPPSPPVSDSGMNFGPNMSYASVAANWAQNDPAAAFAWIQQLPDGPARESAVDSLISTLAASDPKAAADYALQLPPGDSRTESLTAVIKGWSAQDPAQAATLLSDLPEGKPLDRASAGLATTWAQQDPAAAAQWVNTLSDGSARDGAVKSLVTAEFSADPSSAFTWASSVSDPTAQFNLVKNVVQQWAAKDPAAATTAAQNYEQSAGLTDQQSASLAAALQHPGEGISLSPSPFNSGWEASGMTNSMSSLSHGLGGFSSSSTTTSKGVVITTLSGGN
jgi:hypothetical protein